jgi:hypothetical protein
MIRDVHPGSGFSPIWIPDRGVKKALDHGSRIPAPQNWFLVLSLWLISATPRIHLQTKDEICTVQLCAQVI